jgi:hypothetical protein
MILRENIGHIKNVDSKEKALVLCSHTGVKIMQSKKCQEQAGAKLCQAQEKLGLAKGTLPEVVFHLL